MSSLEDVVGQADLPPPDKTVVMDKIQKLIDQAYGTDNEFEKQTFLAKADEMMLKWSLDQELFLDPTRPNTAAGRRPAEQPVMRVINYFAEDEERHDRDLHLNVARIAYQVFEHMHVRIGDYLWTGLKVVGYPTDLDWAHMLFLAIKMDLVRNLDPKVNIAQPWTDSLILLKKAGFTWEDSHKKLQVHPRYDYLGKPWERKMGVRFTGIYKQWSETHPDEIRNRANPAIWRKDFAESYVATVARRMKNARETTMANNANLPALLNDRKSVVEEAYYNYFPERRPHKEDCPCEDCHWIKCHNQSCPRPKCKASRAQTRSARRPAAVRDRAYSQAAREAGSRAANLVDINNPHARQTDAPRKELG